MEVLLHKCNVSKQPLILAVDDQEDNLVLLMEILKPFGCKVIPAADGESSIALAQNYLPDLILLDVMLPDIHGIEVVTRLRKNPHTKDIPIIAVTGLARDEDRDRLLGVGCNDYICKPYMLQEFEALISAYLPAVPMLA